MKGLKFYLLPYYYIKINFYQVKSPKLSEIRKKPTLLPEILFASAYQKGVKKA